MRYKRAAFLVKMGIVLFCLGPMSLVRADPSFNMDDVFVLIQKGEVVGIEKLLHSGLDPNAVGPGGASLLKEAVVSDQLEITRLLLKCGANPQAKGNELLVVFAIENKNIKMVELLIYSRAYVNIPKRDWDQRCPLVQATREKEKAILLFLLDHGADPNGREVFGGTALHLAAVMNNMEYLELLLRYGAAIDQKDNFGKTALMEACQNGSMEAVNFLLTRGAKAHEKDIYGRDAAQLAREEKQPNETIRACADGRE